MSFEEWKFAASTLRLELYGRGKDYAPGLSFSSLARATHDTIDEPSYSNTNMRGRWHVQAAGKSFDVLVMRQAVHGQKNTYHYTRVMARIPRPLFVGLLFSHPRPLDPLFGTPNPMSGERELDGEFSFAAAYPDEALAILRRAVAPPNDVVDHLLAAAERCREVTVTDTSVEVHESFTTDPAAIAPLLHTATALAAILSLRRPPLPRNAAEATVIEALRGFASRTRLTLDADTLSVRGHLGSVAVEMRTESEEGRFFTCLTLTPAKPLELGLRLTRQGTFQFIATLFGSRDVTVGDEDFDATFVVKGRDEAAVRGFFSARPEAVRALTALGKVAGVWLTDAGLSVEWRTILGDAELTAFTSQLMTFVALLDPSAVTSPYR
jgi:hypothetical protein